MKKLIPKYNTTKGVKGDFYGATLRLENGEYVMITKGSSPNNLTNIRTHLKQGAELLYVFTKQTHTYTETTYKHLLGHLNEIPKTIEEIAKRSSGIRNEKFKRRLLPFAEDSIFKKHSISRNPKWSAHINE